MKQIAQALGHEPLREQLTAAEILERLDCKVDRFMRETLSREAYETLVWGVAEEMPDSLEQWDKVRNHLRKGT